ncbi:TetR/AcrR family transcriptional regulator [Delftia acidovorans]|jgi:AcrR family transcriptional regulator|uniref:TetR/AcrR family transcriptional regulator n=1 Tax=Delftia acidovorans TaxID=80866 RepID=UPI002FDD0675
MTSSTDDTAAEEPRAQARERLLQAAEQLFARHGYAGTSLRAVMALADVDTGAIHYHFRNKLGLLKALFEQRVMAVNGQRHALLQRLEQQSPQPAVEDILRAFIAPALRAAHSEGEADFNRVTALCSVDPDQAVREVVFAAYDEAAKRFAALLRQALPQLSQHDFQWRLECMYGAMMYIRSDNGRVSRMLGGSHRADPVEHVIDELVAFTAAGFRAAGIRAAGPRAAQ